jgi:hypothetical protein
MKRHLVIICALCAIVLFAAPRAQERAEVALRAAMDQETVKGDLKGAIEAYRKIIAAFPTNRAIQAQALLRMAGCYQKLGEDEARAVYERIVHDYADQPDVARLARAQLELAPLRVGAARARRVAVGGGRETSNLSGILMGSVSADGKHMVFTDWSRGASDLTLRDLTSGTDQLLVAGGKESYPDQSSISGDGTSVAYVWWNDDADRYELRVVGVRAGRAAASIDCKPGVRLDRRLGLGARRQDGCRAVQACRWNQCDWTGECRRRDAARPPQSRLAVDEQDVLFAGWQVHRV